MGNDVDKSGKECIVNHKKQSFNGELTQFSLWERELLPTDIVQVYQGHVIGGELKSWTDFLHFVDTENIFKKMVATKKMIATKGTTLLILDFINVL